MRTKKASVAWLFLPLAIVAVFAAAGVFVALRYGDTITGLINVALKLVVIP